MTRELTKEELTKLEDAGYSCGDGEKFDDLCKGLGMTKVGFVCPKFESAAREMTKYQRYDSETEEWVDFPEFVKFNQPTWLKTPEHFSAWVIKNTSEGRRLSCELMREVR